MLQGGRITKIEPQRRHPHRRSVFLDGEFAFGLDEEVVHRAGLQEGENLTPEQIDQLLLGEERKRAKDYVFRLLSVRSRSCAEVRDRLKDWGYHPRVAEEVIGDLQRVGLLNDAEFAREWVRDRLHNRPRGKRVLRQELQRKGVGLELIERALEEAFREVDEVELATELLRGRVERYRSLERAKARRRMVDFLARRGFPWGVIEGAVERVKEFNSAGEG